MYKGYVITLQGDTLKGKIEMLSPSLNEVKVKLVPILVKAQFIEQKKLLGMLF